MGKAWQWKKVLKFSLSLEKYLEVLREKPMSSNILSGWLEKITGAKNFRMLDIEINAWSPGFTKPEIRLIRIHIQEKSLKFNKSACNVKMRSLTFEKPIFYFLRISSVDGVISVELNIDWTNVSFGLMYIKTDVQNDYGPQIW